MDPHSQHIRDIKSQMFNIIKQRSTSIDDINTLKSILWNNSNDWIYFCYINGYIVPGIISISDSPSLIKRQEALKKNYQIWKSLRKYLELKFRPLLFTNFYPCEKNIIFDFSHCSNIHAALSRFIMMIINYIPLFNIYQYNPLPGTGYKYYSGEPFIFYYILDSMDKNQKDRTVTAASSTAGITKDLLRNPLWKIVIMTGNFQGLNSWKRVLIYDDNLDLNIFYNWLGIFDLFEIDRSKNFIRFCKAHNIAPFPYFNYVQFTSSFGSCSLHGSGPGSLNGIKSAYVNFGPDLVSPSNP